MNFDDKIKSFKPQFILGFILLVIIVLLVVLYVKKERDYEPYRCTNYAMGTYIEQTVYGDESEKAVTQAAADINELENQISWRIENSDISKINTAAGNSYVNVNESTIELLKLCKQVALRTNGGFDPAILPISSLWIFDKGEESCPTNENINKFLPYIDYNNLIVDEEGKTAYLKNQLCALDLGGVGKGLACERAIKAYESNNVDSAIISVGGSIGVMGNRKSNPDWNIAIRDPFKAFEDQYGELGIIKLRRGYISTSGIYEKYFYKDGKCYHHILDPLTGYPVENNLICVSIMSDNGALSDALSTGCFVMGMENSLPILKYYNAQAVFVTKDREIYITKEAKDMFELKENEYSLNILDL